MTALIKKLGLLKSLRPLTALLPQRGASSSGLPNATLERLMAQTQELLRQQGAEGPLPQPSWPAAGAGAEDTTPANDDGGFSSGHFAHRFGPCDYKLYVPPRDADTPARPLLLMLHGCTQNPDDFAAGTRMNEAAAAAGFVVLYPAQDMGGNPQRCWNWFKHNHQERGRGEAAKLADLTRHVIDTHDIDATRVYVAGLSAGGAMAAVLGKAYPDLFAAVGMHSGLPVGAATDLPSALAAMRCGPADGGHGHTPASTPTIVIHGDRDTTVHPANAEHAMRAFANVHGGRGRVETLRVQSAHGVEGTRVVLRNAAGSVVAEHLTVHGLGHAWSGGSAAGSYTMPSGPSATQAMVEFFQGQRLDTPLETREAA